MNTEELARHWMLMDRRRRADEAIQAGEPPAARTWLRGRDVHKAVVAYVALRDMDDGALA